MAPTDFRSLTRRGTAAPDGGTTMTVAKPAGVVAGDLLLVVGNATFATFATPAGWTLLQNRNTGAGTRSYVWAKSAVTGEPATWVWTSTGDGGGGTVNVDGFAAAYESAVVDASTAAWTDYPASPVSPSVTASVAGRLVALCTQNSYAVNGAPTGMTARQVSLETAAADVAIASGATGTKTWPRQGGDNGGGWGASVAIRSANAAPNAPILTGPASGSTQNLAAGHTFTGTFSDPDAADTMSAAAFRRLAAGGGAYEYWNEAAAVWQSTVVWNTRTGTAISFTFGAGKFANGTSYSWSMATKDAAGLAGPFATDATVLGGTPATVTVTGPAGSVTTTSRPTVTWSLNDPEGDPQERYQVKVFSAAQYGAGGFDPATSSTTWDSTETLDVTARARQVGVDLANGTTYRAYVRVRTSGQWSTWQYSTFTLALTAPAAPTFAVAVDAMLDRVVLTVTGTHASSSFPTTAFVVEYSDDAGGSWATVRGAGALPGSGTPGPTPRVAHDHEARPGRRYRARTEATV